MTPTTITRTNGCWCSATRPLIGANVTTPQLGTRVTVVDTDHTVVDHQPRCWLIGDDGRRHRLPDDVDTLDVSVSPVAVPIRHDDEILTLDDAALYVCQYEAHWTDQERRPPRTPPTTESVYTRGRIRRVPATGRWAADLGFGGTTRSLGEYDDPQTATDAVWAANRQAWDEMEAWCRRHVSGAWTAFERGAALEIQVVDEVTAAEAAAMAGVSRSTWDSYVSRGTAPSADVPSADKVGPVRWRRSTVLAWMAARPGQGTRTDLES